MDNRFDHVARGTASDRDGLDLDNLLHPALAFDTPSDVVADPDLTLNEKRAILASWASDACAVDAAPALRRVPGSGRAVSFDDVMEALRTLDRQARATGDASDRYRRLLRRRDRHTLRSRHVDLRQ